ncbi:MAG: 4'-phosphopantetheinyl transferase family protein [Flammeovirgaceae bacterium]
MPITSIESLPSGAYWGLWEISESENELLHAWKFPLTTAFEKFKIRSRRKEWLAGRLLLQGLANEVGAPFTGIEKDEHQKPFLKDAHHQISLSHTKGYATAIIHPSAPIGIDIERNNPKINRIVRKFLNDEEVAASQNQEKELLTYWCAKEAMYKLNGRKGMIFKEQILVNKTLGESQFTGQVINEDLSHDVALNLVTFGIYTICIAEKK